MKFLALVFAAFLASCSLGPPAPPASEDMREVKFWHDVARGVGCWIWYGSGRGGIACLPDSQYRAPQGSAQNAPAPSQGGAGRPEAPGVAPAPIGGLLRAYNRHGAPTQHEAPVRIGSAGPSVALVPALRLPERVGTGAAPTEAILAAHIGTAAGAIRGTARWFATGPNGVAAAGPRLRAALGSHWRGTLVGVTYRGRTVWARLSDWCGCGSGSIIDLPDELFRRLAPLSRGVLAVTVHWGDRNTLPATDTEP